MKSKTLAMCFTALILVLALVISGCGGGGSSSSSPTDKTAGGVRAQATAFIKALESKDYAAACEVSDLAEKTSQQECEAVFKKAGETENASKYAADRAEIAKWNISINGNEATWLSTENGKQEKTSAIYKEGSWILVVPASILESLKASESESKGGESTGAESETESTETTPTTTTETEGG
jgi:hypothetical protein